MRIATAAAEGDPAFSAALAAGRNLPSPLVWLNSVLMSVERARVICFSPGQVEALPEFESDADVWDFAQAMALAADPVYLDFESPLGAPRVADPLGASEALLRGYLI